MPTFLPDMIAKSSPDGVVRSLVKDERLTPFEEAIVPISAKPELRPKPLLTISHPKTAFGKQTLF